MKKPELVVLCYHGISDTWPDETAVARDDFTSQIEGFLRRGYRGATFTDALTAPRFPRTVVVTFDDAATSVLEQAAPVLAEHRLPATVFVPTDYPDSGRPMAWPGLDGWVGTPHEPELECMGWSQLEELGGAGWEIGSHTCSHPRLAELDDAALSRELADSKAECERRLGVPCRSLAYPYGDADAKVARAAREAGYGVAATVPVGPTSPLPLLWPRVGAYNGESARRIWLRTLRRAFPFR